MMILLILLCLSGCTHFSETFDSTPGKGVGAKSITTVNQMIDQNQLKKPDFNYHDQILSPGQTKRLSESVLRIWLAPYIDPHGNAHEASYVNTVIRPSRWASFKSTKEESFSKSTLNQEK